MKLILGKGDLLINRLLLYDAMEMMFREITIEKNPACPMCGENPTIHELIDYEVFCESEGREGTEGSVAAQQIKGIRVLDLDHKLQAKEPVVFLDVREEWEQPIYPFPDSIKVPYSKLVSEWESLLDYKEQPIVVCCLFGWRSQEAVRLLQDKGFRNIWNLEGGLEEWFLYQEQLTEDSMPVEVVG
jgi:adenylyltransferase/sulfurtransferase